MYFFYSVTWEWGYAREMCIFAKLPIFWDKQAQSCNGSNNPVSYRLVFKFAVDCVCVRVCARKNPGFAALILTHDEKAVYDNDVQHVTQALTVSH